MKFLNFRQMVQAVLSFAAEALSYSFWRTLSEQHQEFEYVSGSPELGRGNAIFEIFSYSYKAIEAEY